MFHHFHSEKHPPKPGSFSAEQFRHGLAYLRKRYRLNNPDVFIKKTLEGSLEPTDVVLTFDDALKSQVDIAVPILKEESVLGIFNVYTSVFTGEPDPLEIYADFRVLAYPDFLSFWRELIAVSFELFPSLTLGWERKYPSDYLPEFPFYSTAERHFRFLRDAILGRDAYQEVMNLMIDRSDYDPSSRIHSLWMDKEDLANLALAGHMVGLHSHTHPTRISELAKQKQKEEYTLNFEWIREELGVLPLVVAHPCGDYSHETLSVLRDLGILVGFRSSLTNGFSHRLLEIPRKDQALLLNEMI